MILDHLNTLPQLKLHTVPYNTFLSYACCHFLKMPLDGPCNLLLRLHYHQCPPHFRLRQL